MKILITGGAGFLGSRLARTLLQRGRILGEPLSELVLADLARPAPDIIADPRARPVVAPLLEYSREAALEQFDLVFHMAGALSAECEANFELGLAANLDSTRALLEAVRAAGNRPRLVFASSVAVFGGDAGLPLPPVVLDNTLPVPQSSYGTQKFICEQLVADYTRRGFIDGRSGRLMTVAVRPLPANRAASGFLSAIVREPLSDRDVVCPVPPEMSVALASPNNTVGALITLAEAGTEMLGGRTAINFPALTITVGRILDALEELAGSETRGRVRFEADPAITRIVGSWPSVFGSERAERLGLRPNPDMRSIIREFMDEHSMARVEA